MSQPTNQPASTETDPTRWVREMLVAVLENTEAVTDVTDQGQPSDEFSPGHVYFGATDGRAYDLTIFAHAPQA